MTDEEPMLTTSEIRDRLQHASTAATRSWIRYRKIEAKMRDTITGEKLYALADVENALAEMPRGPYGRRPPAEEPHSHELDDHRPPDR